MKMLFITTSSQTRACVLNEQPGIDFNSIECGEYSTEIAKGWITDPEQSHVLEFATTEDDYFNKVAVVCEHAVFNKTVAKYRTLAVKERLAKYPHLIGGEIGIKHANNKESIKRYNDVNHAQYNERIAMVLSLLERSPQKFDDGMI